jgi:hypothetical protein
MSPFRAAYFSGQNEMSFQAGEGRFNGTEYGFAIRKLFQPNSDAEDYDHQNISEMPLSS